MFRVLKKNQQDWNIRTDLETQRYNAFDMEQSSVLGSSAVKALASQDLFDTITFVYQSASGNMLTAANMAVVRDVESIILQQSGYPNYCWLNYATNPSSPVRLAAGCTGTSGPCQRDDLLCRRYPQSCYSPASLATLVYGYTANPSGNPSYTQTTTTDAAVLTAATTASQSST